MAQQIFERYEKKFMLTGAQYRALREVLDRHMTADQYGEYTISNIYFDTDDFELIRTSLRKPKYKEKLRLRAYGHPGEDSEVYVELKKKFDGIVYKRRIGMPMYEARGFLYEDRLPDWGAFRRAAYGDGTATVTEEGTGRARGFSDIQILREIEYTKQRYGLRPKVMIAYDRFALAGNEDPELRVTFDRNIRCRDVRLDLAAGDTGEMLLTDDRILMEVKIPGAMPVWMAKAFSELGIRMISFSKYGAYYEKRLAAETGRKAKERVAAMPEVAELRQRISA